MRFSWKRLGSFGLIVCALSASAFSQTSFQFLEQPGHYPVGIRVVDQYDRSRTFPAPSAEAGRASAKKNPRPLQTLIWYPASRVGLRPMNVGDYAGLFATETSFDAPAQTNRWRTLLDTSLSVSMRAYRNAPPADGHFPVVIYAPGQSSVAWDNADLCEYLASHGYVVIASPSLGTNTHEVDDSVVDIDTEARDISFLVSYARTLPYADATGTAVMGWSWGGIANLFAASRDHRISALVAFDGSMRYYPGFVKSAGVQPDRMTQPLLFFTQGDISLEDQEKFLNEPANHGPNVLNEWRNGDLLTVHMLGMAHPDFASMYQRKESEDHFKSNQVADYGRGDVNSSYAWVARYTLMFLDTYLKRDLKAAAFLKKGPAENGVPKHLMAVSFRPSEKAPPSSTSHTPSH